MGVVGRLTALVVTLAATAAGTSVLTLPEAVAAEGTGDGTVTIKILAFDDDLDIRVWRREGDDVVPVTGFVEESLGWHVGWHRLSKLPRGVELTLSAAPWQFRSYSLTEDVETFLGREPSAETADWFTIDDTSGFLRLPELRLVSGTSVVGTVTDLEGRPWSGHSPVRVRSWIRTASGLVRGPVGETDPTWDHPGRFVVTGLWPGAEVTVGMDPQEAPVTTASFVGGATSVEDADLVTTRPRESVPIGTIRASMEAAWVTGTAVDDDGIAYGGAEVTGLFKHASRPSYETSTTSHVLHGTDGDGRWGTHVLWGDEARFRLSVKKLGDMEPTTAWVGGASYESAHVFAPQGQTELGADTVTFDRAGAVVRGRLFNDLGSPIRQTRLRIDIGDIWQEAITNGDGVFELTGIPLGQEQTFSISEPWTGRTVALEGIRVDRPLVELPDATLPSTWPRIIARVVDDDSRTRLSDFHLVRIPAEGEEWNPRTAGMELLGTNLFPGTYGLYIERIPEGNYSWSDVIGWWWGGRRPTVGSPYAVTVSASDTGTIDLGEVRVPTLTELTGTVRDSEGIGLSDAVVTVTSENGHWLHPSERSVVTNGLGQYSILVAGATGVQVSVERDVPGAMYEPEIRGTVAQPLVVDGTTQTEDFVLDPVWDPSVGAVAGVRDQTCLQKTAQQAQRELEIAMVNGVLVWVPQYETYPTLVDWLDPAKAGVAIAPLMGMRADMSWGRATDGSLCFLSVTDDVTHQIWISPPGPDGSSDVTINYDHVSTPPRTGEDRPVVTAGWSDGRTAVVLPGAGDEGDYDDDGRYALVKGSRGSSQPGRYRFRHVGFPTGLSVENVVPPTIQGVSRPGETVRVDPGVWTADGRVVDDMIFTYQWSGIAQSSGPTRLLTHADGGHEVHVTVKAWYQGMRFTDQAEAHLAVEESTGPDPIVVTTSHGRTLYGVPIVWNTEAQLIVVHGCADVEDPRYTVRFGNDTPDMTGPMTVGSVGEDGLRDYYISIPELPTTGVGASIHTNVQEACVPGSPLISTTIYIDPAGTVVDQYGYPLDHARATLFRADTENGDYTRVPAGSEVMSEGNRENPVSTYGGAFPWDVAPGWYQVRASDGDRCQSGWSVPMQVPPARVAVLIKIWCSERRLDIRRGGDAEVGSTVTATPHVDPALPDPVITTQWYRNNIPVPGAIGTSYTLGPYDAGRTLMAHHVARRAPYTPDDGRGRTITFEAIEGWAYWFVPGTAISLPTPTPTPTPSPVPTPTPVAEAPVTSASMTSLRLVTRRPSPSKARVRVRVRTATGVVPTGVVEIRRRGAVVGRVVLRVGDTGRVVVRLKGLRKVGRHRITAAYLGSTTVEASRSRQVALRIRSAEADPRARLAG